MKLTKTIFANDKEVNIFNYENEQAQNEFIDLLIDKVKNTYKIKITFDHIKREVKANLFFEHIKADETIIKYKYTYLFYDIENNINI